MKRAIWLTLFGVLAFAGIVAARLPAGWVLPGPAAGPKSDFACGEVDGTIWNGTCAGLTADRQAIGDVTWELHASRLLAGKLNAAVELTRAAGTATGTVEVGFDKVVTVRDLRADLPIDPTLMPQVPRDLHGNIHAELALLQVAGRTIKAVEGQIEAHDLMQGVGPAARQIGSYSLKFPPGNASGTSAGVPTGQLRDLGGPLSVEGMLRLTPEPGFDLQGLVTARPTAPPDLAREIQYLGSPDTQGRRPFALAATF